MGGTTKGIKTATALINCEAAFGVTIPIVSLVDIYVQNNFNPAKITPAFRTDAGRITGARGVTNRQRETAEGMLSESLDASTELIVHGLALGYGNATATGSADPWTQTIKHPSVCTSSPKSTSFLQGIECAGLTQGYKSYKGASLSKMVISMKGQGRIELTREWKLDGSEVTQAAATFPASFLSLTYLLSSHLALKLYPNGGGAITISSSRLVSLQIEIDFGLTKRNRAGNSIYVPGWRFAGDKPSIKITFEVEGDKSDVIYGYFENDTLLTAQVVLDPGVVPSRAITMDMAKCYLIAEEGNDDTDPTLKCTIDEIDVIANQGPAIWSAKTGVAAYNVPLP